MTLNSQRSVQAVIVSQAALDPTSVPQRLALFTEAGVAVTDLVTVDTGASVVLTGYTSGSAGAVAATDTVNQAIAKLEATEPTGAQVILTGYTSGSAGTVAATDSVNQAIAKLEATESTGAQVILTGFVTGSAAAIAATDTLNAALAKLQARIVALEV